MLGLGTMLYVSLLLINAMAILNEERFLARIGWTTSQTTSVPPGFQQPYDPMMYGGAGMQQPDIGVKARLVNLISAVRTLMRVPLILINVAVIGYELVLGG